MLEGKRVILRPVDKEDVSFYLVKVEAVVISASPPAPLFSVIAEPTEISKEIGKKFDGIGLKDQEKWPELQENLINAIIKMKEAFSLYIKRL